MAEEKTDPKRQTIRFTRKDKRKPRRERPRPEEK